MVRSHSRHSYPNDKMLPREDRKGMRCKHTSEPGKTMKHMHNRKVRYQPIPE